MECPTPVACNEDGKLPYDVDLRAPEEKRRRMQSFAAAALPLGSVSQVKNLGARVQSLAMTHGTQRVMLGIRRS